MYINTKTNKLTLSFLAACALIFSGCTSAKKSVAAKNQVERANIKRVLKKNSQKTYTKNNLFKKRVNVASTKLDGLLAESNTSLPHGSYLDFPKHANSGQCFAKVTVPAQYKYRAEKVLVKPETKTVKTIPAKFKMVSKSVLVKEASISLKAIPATYKKVSEQIMVSEPKEILKTHPPVYKIAKEKILVRPARKVWKIGREWKQGSLATKYADSGEIRCLVEEPAVYKTITKKVLVQPARTESLQVPAVYKTITKTIVDQPARAVEVDIPEVVKTVKVRQMVKEPSSYEKKLPAIYKTVKRKIITQEPYQMWTKILCRTNDESQTVRNLQAKLKKMGYYTQGVDGVIGPSTHEAVKKYQAKIQNRSYYDGRITYDTLKTLNIL